MPSDITIRRLNGLVTYGPDSDGKATDLIRCDNVQFDQDGMARARSGLHFISNTALNEFYPTYVGATNFFESVRFIVTLETWYVWDGTKNTPTLIDISTRAFTGGSRTSNVVTLTGLPAGHNIQVGATIKVDAADNTYDGTFTVDTSSATSITYAQVLANDASSGAGIIKIYPPDDFQSVGVEFGNAVYFTKGMYIKFFDSNPVDVEFHPIPGFPFGFADRAALVWHADRMWTISFQSGSPRLYFSAPGDPLSWPAANFIDVGDNNWYAATGLYSFQGRLYIWTSVDMWALETPGVPTTWVLRRFARIGSDAGSTVEHDGVLYWCGPEGIYSYTGSEVEKISDPIEDIIFSRQTQHLGLGEGFSMTRTAAFRDLVIFQIRCERHFDSIRTFVFNPKLKVWSEWTFAAQTNSGVSEIYPSSIWAEEADQGNVDTGIYMTWTDENQHGFLVGTELDADYKVDETGTRTGTPTVTERPYSVVIQTKYSDFEDAYNKKRVLDWVFEYEGRDLLVEQLDERFATIDQSFPAPVNSRIVAVSAGVREFNVVNLTVPTGHGISKGDIIVVDVVDATYDGTFTVLGVKATSISYRLVAADDVASGAGTVTFTPNAVYLNRARGIGYFRKVSLKITASNFKYVGFKLYGIFARMRVRGRQITSQEQLKR